jgi:hypothetical protein
MASHSGRRSVAAMTDSSPTSPVAAEPPPLVPIRSEGFFGGARLLAADARVVSLLIDDARRRTMERLLGIPRDQPSGVETVIALAVLAGALRSRAPHRPARPGVTDAAIGFGVLREAAYDVAGPWARESNYFGTLLAFALAGAGVRMAVRKSVHGVKGLSRQGYAEFHHRYGHLILRNRRRGAGPRERGSLPLSDM